MPKFDCFGPGTMSILQFPDERVYNATKMLKPQDRPLVPTRMVDNPEKRGEAWYDPDTKDITINRASKTYHQSKRHLQRLAAVIAHENVHARNPVRKQEQPAYRRQFEVLRDLGERDRMLLMLMERQGDIRDK